MTQMTRPHWGPEDQWTGFYLLIVPVDVPSASANDLYERVRGTVESDVVLSDAVAVGTGQPLDGSSHADEAVASALISGALAPGYFFAPHIVFGCVLVGTDDQHVTAARNRLEGLAARDAPPILFLPQVLTVDSGGYASSSSVDATVGLVETLIAAHARDPGIAVSEEQFLSSLGQPSLNPAPSLGGASHAVVDPNPAAVPTITPSPTPRSPIPPVPYAESPASPLLVDETQTTGTWHSAEEPARGQDHQAGIDPETTQTSTKMHTSAPPALPPSPADRPASIRGLRRGHKTASEPESLNRLSRTTNAVLVVYLIFVPDDQLQTRGSLKRRRAVAMELIAALATVASTRYQEGPMDIRITPVYASSPLAKTAVLVPPAQITKGDFPKIRADGWDYYETIDSLVEAHDLTLNSLENRGVQVLGSQFIFLSTTSPVANRESMYQMERLSKLGWITWIHFGPKTEMIPDVFSRVETGANHVHLLLDQPDITAAVMHWCAPLYKHSPAEGDLGDAIAEPHGIATDAVHHALEVDVPDQQ